MSIKTWIYTSLESRCARAEKWTIMLLFFITLQEGSKRITSYRTVLYGTIRHLGDTGKIGTVRSYFWPLLIVCSSHCTRRHDTLNYYALLPSHAYYWSALYEDISSPPLFQSAVWLLIWDIIIVIITGWYVQYLLFHFRGAVIWHDMIQRTEHHRLFVAAILEWQVFKIWRSLYLKIEK